MVGAESDLRVGVPRLEFDRPRQTVLDLATQALRQRLDHRNALAVTAQRIGVQVPGIGVRRRFFLLLFAAPGNIEQ